MPIKFPALSLLLLATFGSTVLAQENPCLNRTLAVNVLSGSGELVQSLSAQDFRGKMHGKSVEITSAAPDAGPRRIAIVLDASGSMQDVWRLEVEVAERLVNADASSAFALIVLGTHVESKIGFDGGRKEIRTELAGLKTLPQQGKVRQTALRDALKAALDLFQSSQFGDALYLISDGHDNASTVSGAQVTAARKLSGVRFFALIPSALSSRGRTEEDDGGATWLRGYATASGGDSIIFVLGDPALGFDAKQVAAGRFSKLGHEVIDSATLGFDNEITRPYRLTVKLPELLNKERDWDLDVVDAKGKLNRNLRILYPLKLAACQ